MNANENTEKKILRHIFFVLVENRSGVLARVAGLFSARGFNIESLSVAETENPRVSRMTIVVPGDSRIMDQVRKQLGKLIDVHEVHDFSVEDRDIVDREMVLIKVLAEEGTKRTEVLQVAGVYRSTVVDLSERSLIVETTGTVGKINGLLRCLEPYGILEVARAGRVAMVRGVKDGKKNDE
ncbi:MAG: acetolactate synthase small subunit [bacterium]